MSKSKRILVLTISKINDIHTPGIYSSLYKEISKDAKVDVFTINSSENEIIEQENVTIYKVKSGPIFKVNKIIKTINLLLLNKNFKKTIKRNVRKNKYDLILYSTPPITLNSTIKYTKKKFNAKTYLLLKDIFPQNAVDLGMFNNKGLIYRYFRRKERNLYRISDYIGTMSKGNLDYIIKNNDVYPKKIETNPNSISIKEHNKLSLKERNKILLQYQLPLNKTTFIYGGNLGVPQAIKYILNVIKENEHTNNHIVIVGDGTEINKLIDFIEENKLENATFINELPKDKYDELLKACDVGLIFLDNRFTIPNIPSRLLSYLEYKKPVIAATDVNTDLKDIIKEGNFGYWCESKNPMEMILLFEKIKEGNNIEKLGKNGRIYLEENYDVRYSSKLILDKLKEG